jgi:hypothetical protein
MQDIEKALAADAVQVSLRKDSPDGLGKVVYPIIRTFRSWL